MFCDASLVQVYNLEVILKWLGFLFGLKINYGKCEMIGVRMEDSNVTLLADVFGCRVGKLPLKYLGLPLCMGMPKKSLWDSIVVHIDKKLSSWKGRYLSRGG